MLRILVELFADTDAETPYTRIIEHKWFEFGKDVYRAVYSIWSV